MALRAGRQCYDTHVPATSPLPPTDPELLDDRARPYFVWWMDATVGDVRAGLGHPDPTTRAYWMGLLLREANTRDVWLFVTPEAIRRDWSLVLPHLGRRRRMWAWLLGMEASDWPPLGVRRA